MLISYLRRRAEPNFSVDPSDDEIDTKRCCGPPSAAACYLTNAVLAPQLCAVQPSVPQLSDRDDAGITK